MVKLTVSAYETLANEAAEIIRAFLPTQTVEINKFESDSEFDFEMICRFEECRWTSFLRNGDKELQKQCFVGEKRETEDDILYKRRIKGGLKETVYYLLKDYLGRSLYYGMLTGVRPLTLANRFLAENSPEKTEGLLQSEYDVSPQKAHLLTETAVVQSKCKAEDGASSLYIHIPFCTTRCNYCSFPSELVARVEPHLDEYMKALEKEVDFITENVKGRVEALYVGGGTPTALPHRHFEKLMEICKRAVDKCSPGEFTLEAGRPDTIDKEKLLMMKSGNVTRISINPQTMQDKTLELIGRRHTSKEIIDTFELARSLGFDNINMDLIMGLTGENTDDIKNTFDKVLLLDPDGITIHVLALKHASELNRIGADIFGGDDFSGLAEEYNGIFRQKGYIPYYLYRQKYMLGGLENAGWCKPGKICIYNIRMMDDSSTCWAAGAGSVSKRCYEGTTVIERRANPKNAKDYIEALETCIKKKLEIMK